MALRGADHPRLTVAVTWPSYDRLIAGSLAPAYGLDIETDTTINGLDPRVAAVVAVALAGDGIDLVFDSADERRLLSQLDAAIASLEPGVIVTWNGAGFDLPFLHDRAAINNLRLGLRLTLDLTIAGRREPLPGHAGAYRAAWYQHRHLDGYQLFRADVGATIGLSCGLKPLSRFVGLPVIEVDRERIHELSDADRRAYVASDARLACALVRRRADAWAAVDQLPGSIGS